MHGMINGHVFSASSLDELRSHLARIGESPFAELWLWAGEDESGAALSALVNGDRGWLMCLSGDDEDMGLSSRDPTYAGPPDATMEFLLSIGQMDTYPVAWTLPTETVLRALEYYFEHGERPPWITWHDDTAPGEG
jgi:Immunity protein Imm1